MKPTGWAILVALGGVCCSSVGPYVWVDDYKPAPEAAPDPYYRIAPGDILAIRVYQQDALSTRERVRPDGKVSIPLLHDVQVAGLSPEVLARKIEEWLKEGNFLNAPSVNVTVEEMRPVAVPVLGEVTRPGQYNLDKGSGVLEALAAAGGFTDFAHRDRIFVLRRQPQLTRIRFTFEALSRGQARASAFRLQAGDAVVVE
jgi:polysaccharide export outer membrane protein